MALAGDEVADSHERGVLGRDDVPVRDVGAEVHDPRALGPHGAAHPLDARAVGQHEARGRERRTDGARPRLRARARVEDVAAVDGDDERRGDPRPPHGLSGGHGVVGVDEVERERAPQPAQRDADRRRRVGAPGPVGARPRRRDERDVLDLQAVELRTPGLAQQLACGGRRGTGPLAQRAQRWDRAVQHEHPHVGPCVSGGHRLAMRPDPQHRISRPGIELGDHRDLHRTGSDHAASARVTYGRSARNARASATGASRA